MIYKVKFERLASETSMDAVLRRPFADEVEDYKEYRRLRQLYRGQAIGSGRPRSDAIGPSHHRDTDGAADEEDPQRGRIDSLAAIPHPRMMRHAIDFGRSDSTAG